MSIAKYIIASLSAVATVTATPQGPNSNYHFRPNPTTLITSTSTPFDLPTIIQPSSPPAADTAAASVAAASASALAKLALQDVTNVARFNTLLTVNSEGKELLPEDELRDRVVFDFGARAAPLGEGGRFVLANANNFPILVDQGIATAVGFLEGCGMNSPHTHPRATEWLTVVQGTLQSGFMLENAFLANGETGQLTTQVSSNLSAFQGTVFPQGSIHFQFNPTCEPATFIATLNSEDPGTSQVAQNFFFLDEKIVNITLGEVQSIDGRNIDEFRKTLPANLVQAVDECRAKCKK